MAQVTGGSAAAVAAAIACVDMLDKVYGMATGVKNKPCADTGYSTEAAHSCCTCLGKGAPGEVPGTVWQYGHYIAADTPGVCEWADYEVRHMPAAHADEIEEPPGLLSPYSGRKSILPVARVRSAIESS